MRAWRWFHKHPLLLAAAVPALIMAGYFIAARVWPFGNNSVMTVDMGQQYIDFYSYYRTTWFGHPGQFFFAFSKDLGGDALGTWAYYLMSPFNLLLLLFPQGALDLAITVMTLAKYAAAGLTMGLYIKRHGGSLPWIVGFGTAFSLSGWMLANQLNLMWLDAAVFLPLIALGVDTLITRRRPWPFLGWLTVAIISNYYMGYMIVLFIIGYFGLRLVEARLPWRQTLRACGRFAGAGLLAGGLSAWLLLPTLFQLGQSKGTYTETHIRWLHFETTPLKQLGKFFAGAFSYGQMPTGQANIFVGSVALIGFVLYFFTRAIPWREKLYALGYSGFLALSISWAPLDLLWHGMQYPVWYPYRFSFVICFWLLVLAWRALALRPNGITAPQLIVALIVFAGVDAAVLLNRAQYAYLTPSALWLTIGLDVLALVGLALLSDRQPAILLGVCFLMVVDAGSNAVLTLNQLSYITHSDYHTYTEALRGGITAAQRQVGLNDRIGKTTLRSKNDAMQVNYLGTDHFTSMMEPATPRFFGALGQSAGDGFVAYTAGTVITDALLDLKGFITPRLDASPTIFLPQVSARPDLFDYDQKSQTSTFTVYENPYALGLGFVAADQILTTKLMAGAPALNQERIMAGLTGAKTPPLLFTTAALSPMTVKGGNVSMSNVTKKPLAKTTTVTYTFTARTTDPYYLQIGANFTDNLVSLTQNGRSVPIYDTFRDRELLNVTPSAPGKKQTLIFTLNKDAADFGDVRLLTLDMSQTTVLLNRLKAGSWHLVQRGDRSLQATATASQDHQVLMTSLPVAPGWHVKVDGHPAKVHKVLGELMALRLSKGTHTIELTYTPPYFWAGIVVSLLALLLTGVWFRFPPRGKPIAPGRLRSRR
ncbi:YfhO family protein [Lacticaseibacillus jixianensis]|uniref:YfhO family protein n=1 Tax=Lacticaseibacillus jixianensis TaxID=2486012 RepID=A0ABW4BA38_9LACO|nr:YfhO family protein [Lacticaseibacillus jixianensis]